MFLLTPEVRKIYLDFFLFPDKPVVSQTPLFSKSAADLRETARLVCEARGVPNVTFDWMRAGGSYISASAEYKAAGGEMRQKYQMSQRVIDPLRASSELLVFNVTNDDYGLYECVARNSEGTLFMFLLTRQLGVTKLLNVLGVTRHRIPLDVKSRPDRPTHLHLVNVTHNAAHLVWTAGFDGGMDQYFRVRYTPLGESASSEKVRYFDVYPANEASVRLPDLDSGTSYEMAVMAFNNIGESNYTQKSVIVTTSSKSVSRQ